MAVDRAMVERAVLEDNPEARAAFLKKHKSSVRKSIDELVSFYAEFEPTLDGWARVPRRLHVGSFLHAAGNTLATSLCLLISGLPLPAGNMIRQHVEAVAMVLLCSTPATGVLELYMKAPLSYSVHQVVALMAKPGTRLAIETHLGVNAIIWKQFADLAKFYNSHSHSGALALGFGWRFGKKAGGIVLGAEYDPQKVDAHRMLLKAIHNAGRNLVPLLRAVDPVMR